MKSNVGFFSVYAGQLCENCWFLCCKTHTRTHTKSNVKLDGFRSQLTYLDTLKSCDTTKQSVCGWQYIRSPTGVEHLGKGIYSIMQKLFEWIEHSGLGSYLSQGHLYESESNTATGVRTHLLRIRSPALKPLHHENTPNTLVSDKAKM